MQKLFFLVLVLLYLPVSSYGENLPLFTKTATSKAQNLSGKYIKEVSAPKFLTVNKDAIRQILSSSSKFLNLTIPVDENISADLKLTEYNILTPDAVINEMTENGMKTMKADVPFKCYKGIYNNDMNSMAIICVSETFVKGILITDNNTYALSTLDENNLSDDCILYENSKLLVKNDFHCGSEAFGIPERVKHEMENLNPDIVSNTFLQANIAVEIDKITYATYGSSIPNTTANTLALFSVVSAIYNRDINVKIVVPFINIWTTTDPYTGTTSNALLTQFTNYWNGHFSSVNRTLAHFITRRTGGLGGIAFVDVLCNSPTNGNGYGFSNIIGAYSPLPLYSWDVMVVAHEMGHNFGSSHTHNCSWPGGPIDTCYTIEGNCYNGPNKPRVGTIMSYCHLTGSIDLRLGFGPLPKALIRTSAENSSCISAAPNALLLSFPQGGESFATSTQQYLYWGTSSTANFNIDLTTNNGTSWTSLATNVPAQQHYYVWTVPYISTSSNCKIKIYDAGNPSLADTVDNVFTIKATMTGVSLISPANSTAFTTTPIDTSKIVFSWTPSGTLPEINYKFKIKKIGGQFVSLPSDSNGKAARFTVTKSKLDSLAALFVVTGDSVLCGWAATSYLNADSLTSEIRILTIKTHTVGVNNISSVIPTEHKLYTNYPNPFNPVTKIKFEIPKDEFVKITVYDLSGKVVSELVNERLQAGVYETDFDGARLASGTYFYKIETNSFVETRKMVLIK
ncbi:MAG: zinc-dependent metalloprotease [Bacteroidetes bacterium]|nr:zinc-dependent metalloprotease [Bacteroidota bacterium]